MTPEKAKSNNSSPNFYASRKKLHKYSRKYYCNSLIESRDKKQNGQKHPDIVQLNEKAQGT